MSALVRKFVLASFLCGLLINGLHLAANRSLTLAEEVKAKPAGESFTVVLLPDTQYYSQEFPEIYLDQTRWIRDNAEKENIKFAIHLGDIVNLDIEPQWVAADAAHKLIDGKVPYSVVPGNHDFAKRDMKLTRDSSLYNKYFPPARFSKYPWYGGHKGTTNDNNYCFFEAGGMKFMVVSLEYAPTDDTLTWAAEVISKHPDHRVIVATHHYLNVGARSGKLTQFGRDGNGGEDIWQKLIRHQPNVFLVACGHVTAWEVQTSINNAGRDVIEMLADYQGLAKGGNGWLRLLRFYPGENKIVVETYSPTLKKFDRAPKQAFELKYEMTPVKEPAKLP